MDTKNLIGEYHIFQALSTVLAIEHLKQTFCNSPGSEPHMRRAAEEVGKGF